MYASHFGGPFGYVFNALAAVASKRNKGGCSVAGPPILESPASARDHVLPDGLTKSSFSQYSGFGQVMMILRMTLGRPTSALNSLSTDQTPQNVRERTHASSGVSIFRETIGSGSRCKPRSSKSRPHILMYKPPWSALPLYASCFASKHKACTVVMEGLSRSASRSDLAIAQKDAPVVATLVGSLRVLLMNFSAPLVQCV